MKELFDLLVLPISISENIFVDIVLLSIVGFISYKSAYFIVGEIGIRGDLGSLIHWIIRIIVYIFLCFVINIFIKIYEFIVSIPIQFYISLTLIISLFLIFVYSSKNKKTILNKKLF
ncbi:MAG: hypothetical protein PHE29_05670 [Tissierellia bacterium]|nr:hypothetical protein [Tissierellia bacterium]